MSKAAHGKSGGVGLTDEVIERLADEAEKGYDVKRLRPRRGRPRMGLLPAGVFQVRLEPELRDALERASARRKISPSELTRQALRRYLKPRGPRKVTAAKKS